jgi:hypothetical protein
MTWEFVCRALEENPPETVSHVLDKILGTLAAQSGHQSSSQKKRAAQQAALFEV